MLIWPLEEKKGAGTVSSMQRPWLLGYMVLVTGGFKRSCQSTFLPPQFISHLGRSGL